MNSARQSILTINGGSSSIKFCLYQSGESLQQLLSGEINNIGKPGTQLRFEGAEGKQQSVDMEASDQPAAAAFLLNWLASQAGLPAPTAIGHRIVHGMHHTKPELVTPALLEELRNISAYDPDHLPAAINLVEQFQKKFPAVLQIACFDTSFHTTMPAVAKLLPLPRRFTDNGIQRYGFHGLSYAYLLQQLEKVAGREAASGRIIFAHLGSGASLAAVKDGKSMDTSMGFTPASGIPMSTRTGDLDPGVAWYLMQSNQYTAEQFNHLINHEAGLLGVSGTSADMKELLQLQHTESRAADAVELFCYQAKKWIGAFAAVLGGVDTLVFSGGMGQQAPEIRSRICAGMQFLGIELNDAANTANAAVVSATNSRVCIRVMKTDEEQMIAAAVRQVLSQSFNH